MSFMRTLVIFFLLLFIINIHAQNQIIFHHLTVEDGLSQSSVNCIFQDVKGFMWFGTQEGLNRFDGYNIKIFKNNPTDSTSLDDNFVTALYEDLSGNMYVESHGGFQRYNPQNETFSQFNKNDLNLSDLKFNSLNAFYVDSNGIQWTGSASTPLGLKKIVAKTGKITIYKHDPSNPSSLSDDKIFSIYRDRSGKLWIGTQNGLDQLDEKSGKFIHYRNNQGDPNSISSSWVWSIFEDSHGNLWVGTVGGGLNKFNTKTGTFVNFKNDPLDPRSLNDNFIYSIYEDRSGVIWIGTNSGGVNYFLPSAQVFNLFRSKPNDKNWLGDNTIQSMYADANGNYWIGTMNSGLYKFDYNKNKFTQYLHNASSANSISSNAIQSIYMGKSGILWIGNFNAGLDAFDPKTNSFKHYKSNPSDPNTLSDNRIYSIVADKKGRIWIGTYRGGLNELDPNTGKIIRFQHDKNNPNSISSDLVWSLALDKSGKLWIGTFGGGINVYDPDKNIFTIIKNNPDDAASLMDNSILRIFIDHKDNVWVGSTQGLSIYNRETKKFKNYREKDGLPNETVFGILEGDKGNLWISTNKGIARFNPETNTFKNYYSQDGLQGNEFNQNAFAKDELTGRLLFGGPNGFNVFNPDLIKDNNFIPPVVFTDYIRYNTDNKGGKPIIEKGISQRDSLLLTYKDNIINLQFSALSYYNTSQNQYKYQLEGFNNNWIQLENNNSVTFTNLSPGDYTLKVIGSNNDGKWNDKGTSLFIEVTPPWWKTNIAYAIYLIFFLTILYFARRIELNRREQKAKIRENELRLKASEAEKRAIQAENERKTKELEEARQLQLSMLPKVLPNLPNLEIAAFMRTATEVGGDYYDFIVKADGLLNVAFGDATGHGLQAGTMVTLMKGFFTSNAPKFELVDFMNDCTATIKEVNLGRILMSFSFLRIKDYKLTITSAGMPPVYYFNKQKDEIEEILIQGMPLGAMKKASYKMIEKELNSGDMLLLITDGIPEQMNANEEMFDYPRVKTHFKYLVNNTPEVIIEKFVKLADDWMGDVAQADDITLVAIKIK